MVQDLQTADARHHPHLQPPPATYTYYRCPHDPGHRAHTTAFPGHPYVSVREDVLLAATAAFFAQYVFGPDRAAMLDARVPADAAADAAQRASRAKKLDKRLDQIETAQQALITELETPADPNDPAAQALRERIRNRYRELHGERATLETQRDQLDTAATDVNDPALLDELPILGDILTGAPAGLTEQLFEAFHVQAVYSKELHQVTIHVTITDATPHAIAQLLADPRITSATQPAATPARTSQAFSHSEAPQRGRVMAPSLRFWNWRWRHYPGSRTLPSGGEGSFRRGGRGPGGGHYLVPLRADRGGERRQVEGPVVPLAVDEERGRPGHAGQVG